MSTTTTTHPSFSIPFFTQLVQRLRYTNARYNHIAHKFRRTQRPTYHAKRRAYRAGLRIDTSKTRVAWPGEIASESAASIQLPSVLDSTTGNPTWNPSETEFEFETEEDAPCTPHWHLGQSLRNFIPEVVAQMQPAISCQLSPLQLELGSNVNVDDSDLDACDLQLSFPGPVPVPGAPRWRSIPLPEDGRECGSVEAMTFTTSVSCTYDPHVWRGIVMATHVSDSVSTPVDVVCAGLGITVPLRHLKRKLRDVKVDEHAR